MTPLGPSGETRVTKILLESFGKQGPAGGKQGCPPRLWGCLRGSVSARGGGGAGKRGCWREESGAEMGSRTARLALTDTPPFSPRRAPQGGEDGGSAETPNFLDSAEPG